MSEGNDCTVVILATVVKKRDCVWGTQRRGAGGLFVPEGDPQQCAASHLARRARDERTLWVQRDIANGLSLALSGIDPSLFS